MSTMTRIVGRPDRLKAKAMLCLLAAAALTTQAAAFVPSSSPSSATAFVGVAGAGSAPLSRVVRPSSSSSRLFSDIATATTSPESALAPTDSDEDDDDDEDEEEWEYVEFENLAEEDFFGSEWKVGTVMDGKPADIKETWARLVTQEGKNIAVWGDGAKGTWNFDVPSQFLAVSKETFGGWLGKKIWAGVVEDYYYVSGTVRGWSPISPASVVGQWQMKRLGVDPEEMGVAPWFQEDDDEDEEEGVDSEKMLKAGEDSEEEEKAEESEASA